MSAKSRWVSVLAVALLAVAFVVTAVLGGGNVGESSDSLFSRKETINLWYTDDAMTDFLNSAAVAYTESQNAYRIEPTLIDATDYIQTLYDASVEGEDFPDVFIVSNDYLERLWLTGLASEIVDEEHFGAASSENTDEEESESSGDDIQETDAAEDDTGADAEDETEKTAAADDAADGTGTETDEDADDAAAADTAAEAEGSSYFCEAALNAVTYQDMILGYPLSFEAAAFLYNEEYLQTMADTAGISLKEAIPGTMMDVITLANSYDAPSNVSAVLKWDVSDIFYNYCFLGYYMSIGGETGDNTDVLRVYNQQLISCLQVYQQLNQFFSIDTSSDDYESVTQDFAEGEIVFTLATSDAVETITQYCEENGTELNYGVTSIPDLTSSLHSKTLSITNCMVINGYSANKEAAQAFIQYVIFENMDSFYSQTGKLPALEGIAFEDEHLEGFYEAYVDSAPITKLRSASNFWMLLENTFAQVWDGEDPNEQLRLLCEQLLIQMTGQDTVTVNAIEDPEYIDIQSELSGGE